MRKLLPLVFLFGLIVSVGVSTHQAQKADNLPPMSSKIVIAYNDNTPPMSIKNYL